MRHLTLLAFLSLFVGAAMADAGLAAVGELGRLNGQALACDEKAVVSQIKALMIRYSPKTRRYGEIFEEQSSAAFLAQGERECPATADFNSRVDEMAQRLPAVLPLGPPQ